MPHVFTVLLLVCTAACASSATSGAEDAPPTRVSFRDYRGGTHFSLVNENHTDRVDLYSVKRTNAITKVASNILVADLMDSIDDSGYDQQAHAGRAPVRSDQWIQSIEVESPDGTSHILMAARMRDDAAAKTFRKVRDAFLDTYNGIFQAQSVESQPGQTVFKGPAADKKSGD
jgi:hypothetical protein